jgi:GTPase
MYYYVVSSTQYGSNIKKRNLWHKLFGTLCYRTLNGFLNTGHGGTVYLGVLDDGTIKGIPMSQFQVNKFRISNIWANLQQVSSLVYIAYVYHGIRKLKRYLHASRFTLI